MTGIRITIIGALLTVVALWPPTPCSAQVDAAAVQRSISRGITYLRKGQNGRGGWEEYGGQSCGLSALCTLALLNAGVPREDPVIVKAMRYLRGFEPKETYSVSLQTLVYCQLGAAGDLPRIRRNVKRLVSEQIKAGRADRIGSWNYGNGIGSGDPSNAQFAILALGAAQDRGVEVPEEVFRSAMKYWVDRQLGNGGWSYRSRPVPTGSMTCAGVASIIIARGRLGGETSSIVGDQIQCCGGEASADDPVERGLAWLGRQFTLEVNPGGDKFTFFYYLYALERVGRLSGRRLIGEHDWYREGAERLVKLQDGLSGFWPGVEPMETREVATSFALLFLSKGKRQVVIGRLQYPSPALPTQWNRHPDSLRQLVRHVEQNWRRDLTWQTIDASTASLTDLLQTPVLVISGQQAIRFPKEVSETLRTYVDQGGCILFEAEGGDGCGDASGFEQSVQELCQDWFPDAPLERLPLDHPVWSAEHKVDPTAISENFWVYGVQACCRTAVFYVPQSLSCRWELGDVLFHRDRESAAARSQIDTAVRIGENMIAYATGRELKDKLQQRLILQASDIDASARGSIQLGMLGIDAGGQEARRALPNAASLMSSRLPIQVAAVPGSVGFDEDQLLEVPFLWVHGRTEFELQPDQREALRNYVQNGGVILGSAVCGSKPFAEAFRREMSQIFPDSPLTPISTDHPLMKIYGGYDIKSVTIRTPATAGSAVSQRTGPPVLEAAMVDNVLGVFFSPLDLSCALESPNSIQCPGYDTEDAAKIVANMVLYALQQ
ncbi:MAG: DUF4159 domain-containing protein [Planctomycetota bacterium]